MATGFSPRTYSYASDKPKQDEKMDTYPASIAQSASDYDELMRRYREMLDRPDNTLGSLASQYKSIGDTNYNPAQVSPVQTNSFIPVTPLQNTYSRSGDVSTAMGNLRGLSETGGYSESDIANLRARGISPIRAVYSNAMENMARQRALQGGYSPNYTAAMVKMARELSEQIASQTTNVNTGIAQNVAQNKLSIAPIYANLAAGENEAINRVGQENTALVNNSNQFNTQGRMQETQANADRVTRANELNTGNTNEANQFNIQNKLNTTGQLSQLYQTDTNKKLNTLDAMKSLYGTTPALPQLYGQQANQAAQLSLQKKQQQQTSGGMLMNAYQNVPRSIMAGGSMTGARF